jgi:hypothetical protein
LENVKDVPINQRPADFSQSQQEEDSRTPPAPCFFDR